MIWPSSSISCSQPYGKSKENNGLKNNKQHLLAVSFKQRSRSRVCNKGRNVSKWIKSTGETAKALQFKSALSSINCIRKIQEETSVEFVNKWMNTGAYKSILSVHIHPTATKVRVPFFISLLYTMLKSSWTQGNGRNDQTLSQHRCAPKSKTITECPKSSCWGNKLAKYSQRKTPEFPDWKWLLQPFTHVKVKHTVIL